MRDSIWTYERRARYLMIVVSILMVTVLLLFKIGLISTFPSYKENVWYSINDRAGLVITKEFSSELGCRAAVPPAVACRSGKAMMTATAS
ncbi:MAG: hypothetical protein JWQ23_4257 [Herminiimonas sp.]|nr:hypothetical protein [Herminiimonas sp.]